MIKTMINILEVTLGQSTLTDNANVIILIYINISKELKL